MCEKWVVIFIFLTSLVASLYHHPIFLPVIFISVIYLNLYWRSWFISQLAPTGRCIFVTGCDSGIGNLLVRRLDTLGCIVIAACRYDTGKGAAQLQKHCSDRLHIVQLELTSEESIQSCVETVKNISDKYGLWGIVNNAGIQYSGYVEQLTMDMYRTNMEINFFGIVRMCKETIPLLRTTKGRILNVTSVLGRISTRYRSAYCATKWAGETFSEHLRREMEQFDISVSIIEPGGFGVNTDVLNQERVKANNLEMLKQAHRDVIAIYGEDHLRNIGIIAMDNTSAENPIYKIVYQMEDALFSSRPKTRYLVDSKGIDKLCIMARIIPYLPDTVVDCLFEWFGMR